MIELLQQVLNGLAIGSVYTLVALGLTVVFGILGIAHFAHGSLAMFGGYLTFVFSTTMGVPFFAAIAMAMPVGAVMGMLIERLAYRPVRCATHQRIHHRLGADHDPGGRQSAHVWGRPSDHPDAVSKRV